MEDEIKTTPQPETEPEEEVQESKFEETEETEQTEETETQNETESEPEEAETEPEPEIEPEVPEDETPTVIPAPQPEKPEPPAVTSEEDLLLPRDTMLSAGIHIGTRMKTRDMEPFIYRVRPDGLFVLDVKKTDERIRIAGRFLSRYDPSKVAVAATRLYAHEPVRKFCKLTGSMPLIGRFIPGMLSNPLYPNRVDPEVIVVSDPRADAQAVKEASAVGIPIVALCSTDNEFTGVDLVIPTNNKGRRALAVIFWLLARQVLRERGELAMDQNPRITVEDFEAKISRDDE
ncbi:MAG: 30S ribosomal protein S2 [Candidatus Bathyarchaeota archaeon]|nr:30S ribosomal protein S2 [Candidatus Bathyarchaeota archaeon]